MNNTINRILSLTLITASWVAASAAVVNDVQAGKLHETMDSPATETTLTVSGTINANDLFFISEEMPALRTLDLSKCSIVACEIDSRRDGSINHREGVIPQAIFAGSKLENVVLPASQKIEIAPAAFAGTALAGINIGRNVLSLGQGAFDSCQKLKTVTIEGSKDLGTHVFANCPELGSVNLTDVDSIASSMFANDKALAKITGINYIMSIGENAFAGCTDLTEFTFGGWLSEIGAGAFRRTGLESADMSKCADLRNIGEWAFAHCTGLKSVVLPSRLSTLGRGIFFDCNALGSVVLPETVTTVGDYALKGLTSVEFLTLPAALGHIGTLAMSGMDNLKAIDAEKLSGVPTLGDDVWDRLNKSDIELRVKSAHAKEFITTPQWQDFKIIYDQMSGIADETVSGDSKVTGRFEGNELVVRSQGDQLTQVNVYDLSGRYLTGERGDDEIVRIDCGKYDGNIFIVEAFTASGVHAAVKLMRNSR